MRLYICIAKVTMALILSVALLAVTASAIPLPLTPPEVDSTPVSHEDEPEGFRDAERIPEPTPKPTEDTPLRALNKTTPQPDLSTSSAEIDTGGILLIGATIWYVVTLVGIAGGRQGVSRRKRHKTTVRE